MVDHFPGYWNAGAIHLDRIIYEPQPDTSVRLVNLQAGQLDMVERLGPTDAAAVRKNPKLRLVGQTALAYNSISINLANHGVLANPLVREALEDSIDRVGFGEGGDRRAVRPIQPVRGARQPLLGRGASGASRATCPYARMLLRQAGMPHPTFTLLVGNSSVEQQAGEVMQSMADEAGFDMKLQSAEANAQVAAARAGDYDATVVHLERSCQIPTATSRSGWPATASLTGASTATPPSTRCWRRRAASPTWRRARRCTARSSDIYLDDRPHIVL